MTLARWGLGLLAVVALVSAGCGGGDAIEGSGYAYDVPDGWAEASEEQSEVFPLADSIVLQEGDDDGFVSNINVIATGPVPPGTDLGTEVERGVTMLQEQPEIFGLPAETEVELTMDPTETTLVGEPAFELEFTTDTGDQVLEQRQITSVSPDGAAFTITASSVGETADRDAAMDEVVESWSWE